MKIVTSRANGGTVYAEITKENAQHIIDSRECYLEKFSGHLNVHEILECRQEIDEACRVLQA